MVKSSMNPLKAVSRYCSGWLCRPLPATTPRLQCSRPRRLPLSRYTRTRKWPLPPSLMTRSEKESIFRVDYIGHGVMPVRADRHQQRRPADLACAMRGLLFITAAGDSIQAAEPEDVQRLMNAQGARRRRDPLPTQRPSPSSSPRPATRRSRRTLIRSSFGRWRLSRTRRGLVFCFTTFPRWIVRWRAPNCTCARLRDADGVEMFYFEIPFDKYLKSKSGQTN